MAILSAAQRSFLVFVQVQANNITWQCCFCHTSNNPVTITDLRVIPAALKPICTDAHEGTMLLFS